jgi:HlyD family secretion protein
MESRRFRAGMTVAPCRVVKPVPYAVRVRRKLLALIGLAGLVAGGYFAYRWWKGEAPPLTYTTAAAQSGDVVQAVTASGTLSPVIKVDVGSQVSGRIQELLVDYNDQVKAGQIIARIDPENTQSQLTQARARLTAARSDLAKARAAAGNAKVEYDRALELAKTGAIAAADVDAARLAKQSADAVVTSSQAQIVESQASVAQAQTNLTYTTIKSPIDGIVISRAVNVGQTVAASLSAPTLFTIAGDLREMEVHTSVAESDVGQLKEGMRVEFSVDAFPEDLFTGTVKQVRFEATTVSNVVTYDAVVTVKNDQLKLRPGMTANVTFVIAEAQDVLTVSAKALRYRPANADELMAAAGMGSGGGGRGEWKGRRDRGGDGGGRNRDGSGDSSSNGSGDSNGSGGGNGNGSGNSSGSGGGNGSGGGGGGGNGSGGVGDASGSGGDVGSSGGTGRRRGGNRPQLVWVLRENKPVPVRVQVGLSDGNVAEIKGGDLKDGDLVITADSNTKSTGSAAGGNRGGNTRRVRGPF